MLELKDFTILRRYNSTLAVEGPLIKRQEKDTSFDSSEKRTNRVDGFYLREKPVHKLN
jgi:hypothetical protein